MVFSFESPIKLLDKSFYYNDYDYLLYHLLDTPEYNDFAIKSKTMNRFSILDNSAYELGPDYDIPKFVEAIKKYQPTYYILPDVIGDLVETRIRTLKFIEDYGLIIGTSKPMGVIQGDCLIDFKKSHKMYIDLGVDYIAVPHACPVFQTWGTGDRYRAQGEGRLALLEYLENSHVITDVKYHILGLMLPQEVKELSKKKYITSLDTSNPILNGLLNVKYDNGTLKSKPSTKMHDVMGIDIDIKQEECIIHNIKQIKELHE